MTVADSRLRVEREAQGLSLRELAFFVGVSHTTVHQLERGQVDASPAIKARIARALRVPVAELWPESSLSMREPGSFPGSKGSRDGHAKSTAT